MTTFVPPVLRGYCSAAVVVLLVISLFVSNAVPLNRDPHNFFVPTIETNPLDLRRFARGHIRRGSKPWTRWQILNRMSWADLKGLDPAWSEDGGSDTSWSTAASAGEGTPPTVEDSCGSRFMYLNDEPVFERDEKGNEWSQQVGFSNSVDEKGCRGRFSMSPRILFFKRSLQAILFPSSRARSIISCIAETQESQTTVPPNSAVPLSTSAAPLSSPWELLFPRTPRA